MPGPTLYIKNALRLAELGLGDGTIYASGTGATPNLSQKTFALAGLSIIADIGADADDKFNGCILYFPTSKRVYHIVDWVAATDTATTYENPSSADVGPCEIRRSLVNKLQLAGSPAKFLADGQRFATWQSAANTVVEIHLPNLLDNGGFETAALAPWIATVAGTGTVATNATTPILGQRDCKLHLGNQATVGISQSLRDLKKNRVYRLLFKARYTGSFTAAQFEAKFTGSGVDVVLSGASSGSIAGTSFRPTLANANGWHYVDVTVPDWDVVGATLQLNLTGAFDVLVDEIYLWEKVNVGAMLLFDHGGLINLANLTGRNVSKDRSGQTVAVDNVQLLGAQTITQGDAALVEFAGAVYPVYSIDSSDLIQAGEILLAQAWTWGRCIYTPFDPRQVQKVESIFKSRSGVEQVIKHSQQQIRKGQVKFINDTDLATWNNEWYPHHHETRHPFAVKLDAASRPLLMVDAEQSYGNMYDTKRPSMPFNWVEVVK